MTEAEYVLIDGARLARTLARHGVGIDQVASRMTEGSTRDPVEMASLLSRAILVGSAYFSRRDHAALHALGLKAGKRDLLAA